MRTVRPRSHPRSASRRARTRLADPDLVAGLEAGVAKRLDDADLAQAALEVVERLGVGEVVAGDEQLDAAALDREDAVLDARRPRSPRRRGAGRRGARPRTPASPCARPPRSSPCTPAAARERRAADQIVEAGAGRRRDRRARSPAVARLAPLGDEPARPPRRAAGRTSRARPARAAGRARRRRRRARRARSRSRPRGRLAGPSSTQVDEQPAALDVGEELVAEPGALGGALDQPGDVGEHELAVVDVDRAEHRLERRERVVGDLRRGARHAARAATTCRRWAARPGRRRRAASAAARSSPTRPRRPLLGEARRLPGGGREALVAVPAQPARATIARCPSAEQLEVRAVEPLHRRSRAEPRRPGPRRARRACWRPAPWAPRSGAEVARRRAARRGRGATRRRRARRRRRGRRRRRRARRAGRAPRGGRRRRRRRRGRPRRRSSPCRRASREAS